MDDDGDHYGGGEGSITLRCNECSATEVYSPDDAVDGFFSCRRCYAVHTSTQVTATDPNDFNDSMPFLRRVPTQTPQTPAPYRTPHPAHGGPTARPFDDFDEPSAPQDFAPGADAWGNPEELVAQVRRRYVLGLQVILQRQLEVLVERHRVGALICGVAGTIWVRLVAASKVFDEMWPQKVLAQDEAVEKLKRSASEGDQKPHQVKYELADAALARKGTRKRWATEGKLPYVAAFTEVDKLLGSALKCPLDARQLFRPVRVIGTWQLEAAAGSIAQRIGLRLPSVNFYAIAQRYLNELSLPVERILPHACHIYEWAMPAELWLSSNSDRIPTRVYVMAILIVSLRFLYNINGQGIWEICEAGITAGGSDPDANSLPSMKPECRTNAFGTKELLCTLAEACDKIDVGHDYSKDLRSYLKYCKDVVFPGIAYSVEEAHLIEIFHDMYKAGEDDNPKVHMEEMQTTNGVNKRCQDGTFVGARRFSTSSGIQRIKSEMEDHGFCYMPPGRGLRSDNYLHYRRKTVSGSLVSVSHADYYILIRAFAKLAEVDIRIIHASVLKLERRLASIEKRIGRSLDALQNLPSLANG
ncbi:hypothetical protein BRADI_1g56620v3 [Brachypodium distachyon]|uniref:Rrn7/TAF1B C-terminal cyclin domain-containing protein n=1 Tax=Brachypodium distachyon TaxID=15368 RepID=A0A2K2DRS8_BRADI|nr:hypothetical protein BRADI_1g56620v3 [Brachypodium distachyon]